MMDLKYPLQEQHNFYADLYSEDKEVNFTMKNHFGLYVGDEVREQQNQQIKIEDLQEAIKGMNNNKTPGEDGIPVDFYKVFWTKLKDPFHAMMLQAYQEQYLHNSARKGILNLIPKAQKDTRLVKNLRPITLLNTDYKILEKAVANKMLPALQHIIHKDQRGFMKDRRISVNIRKMLDIIEEAKKEDLEALVLSLDFVKCFDKCSFSILHGSLDFFGFGEIIKEWTKILYTDFTVKIQNNRHFSKDIQIQKGVHQGGCCSSIYFLVIAEILALSLRNREDIEGVTIKDIKNLLNQFADDMDIFSLAKQASLRAILQELEDFRKQSGFTMSYEKTTLYRIGSLRHSNAQLYNLSQLAWSNQDITVLGVKITHEDLISKNYCDLIEKARSTLNSWYNRDLSLLGKVQVVNTLVASLFVYKMMVLPSIPSNIVKCLDNIIRDYIWKGKKSKINYKTLQNPKKEGGLNLVNLTHKDISLKATWPLILSSETEYATMVYRIMRCNNLQEDIWRCTLRPDDVKNLRIGNSFWQDVLYSWACFNGFYNHRPEYQLLWYNSNIRIAGKPFFWKDAYEHGLKYVYQLFNQKGFKAYQEISREFQISQMRYNSLKTAIPKNWREDYTNLLKYNFLPMPPGNYDQCTTGGIKNVSSTIYNYIAGDAIIIHNKFLKWKMENQLCGTLMDFREAHLDIYRVTNIPKYRSFQYRILQRGLVTNIQLQKWNITSTDLCTFCAQERETMSHLFFECDKVQEIWTQLIEWLQTRFLLRDQIVNPQAILLNRMVEKRNHAINFICLLTKQYIYAQRCMQKPLSFKALKAKIQTTEKMEKYIATKNDKLSTHARKWSQNL